MSETVYSRDPTTPRDYYSGLDNDGSLIEKFKDIDDKAQFYGAMRRLEDPLTKNFVLDFGNDDAWCASDLDTDELQKLLSKPVRLFETSEEQPKRVEFLTPSRSPGVSAHVGCKLGELQLRSYTYIS